MGQRILLVDDEKELVELIKQRLEASGYEVLTAYNGPEALEKAKDEDDIELIILDIMMPVIDGIEVLRRLRNEVKTRMVPVVMLTAKGDTESMMKAGELGSTDYVIKPFDAKELLDLIKKYI